VTDILERGGKTVIARRDQKMWTLQSGT